MVLSEMTRTSCVRIVERKVTTLRTYFSAITDVQVIEDGTVLLSECTAPTLFVVFVVVVSCLNLHV
jgi:hypothetical protein